MGGVALILFFGGIRRLGVVDAGVIFFCVFRQLLASRFSSLAHHHKAVSMGPRRPLGRPGSPFNDFGIDFGTVLDYFFIYFQYIFGIDFLIDF